MLPEGPFVTGMPWTQGPVLLCEGEMKDMDQQAAGVSVCAPRTHEGVPDSEVMLRKCS